MRKLLIFGILAGAVAIVIVMSSMRPQPVQTRWWWRSATFGS